MPKMFIITYYTGRRQRMVIDNQLLTAQIYTELKSHLYFVYAMGYQKYLL